MSTVSLDSAINIDMTVDELEETSAQHAPSTMTALCRDALPPAANAGERGAVIDPDPVAEIAPWIPVVVPLLGAMMAFNAYFIGWAVPVRPRDWGPASRRCNPNGTTDSELFGGGGLGWLLCATHQHVAFKPPCLGASA